MEGLLGSIGKGVIVDPSAAANCPLAVILAVASSCDPTLSSDFIELVTDGLRLLTPMGRRILSTRLKTIRKEYIKQVISERVV